MHGGGDLGTMEEWKLQPPGLEADGQLTIGVRGRWRLCSRSWPAARLEWKQCVGGVERATNQLVITEWIAEGSSAAHVRAFGGPSGLASGLISARLTLAAGHSSGQLLLRKS